MNKMKKICAAILTLVCMLAAVVPVATLEETPAASARQFEFVDPTGLEELTSEKIHFGDKKYVSITFDDGPGPSTTPELLDTLAEFDAKATFFILGTRINKSKDTIRRMSEEGHEVASHTWNHLNLNLQTNEKALSESDRVDDALEEILGYRPSLIRAPYGNSKDRILKTIKKPFIYWTVDSKDWQYMNANKTYNHVVANADEGEIILLHDIYQQSVDAARLIIEDMTERGYEFVTVSELAALHSGNLKKSTIHYHFRPEA